MDLLSFIARNFLVMDSSVSHSQTSTLTLTQDSGDSWRTHRQLQRGQSSIEDVRTQRRYSVDSDADHSHISKGLQRHTSLSDFRQISWSEYTARKSRVKFRNRRSASFRSRDQYGGMPPSALAVRVLSDQYEVCRDKTTPMSERVMAVFYCWYFGWITDVYNSLTHGGVKTSFTKWFLSCLLVTLGATILIGVACIIAHGLLLLLTHLTHSAVTFTAFLAVLFVTSLGSVTILSYSRHHGCKSPISEHNHEVHRVLSEQPTTIQ